MSYYRQFNYQYIVFGHWLLPVKTVHGDLFAGMRVYSWSSLDKGESLACQIKFFPIQQKDRLFCKAIFLILFAKTTQLIVEWGSYLASQ